MTAKKGAVHGPGRVLVAGCMVNRYGDELARSIPEVDAFIGLDELRSVGQALHLPLGRQQPRDASQGAAAGKNLIQIGAAAGGTTVAMPSPSEGIFDHTSPRLLTTRGHAFLKVAEGCNNPCTFCAIPSWRGRFRSRSIPSLVEEAQRLEAEGIQELCLIAQDTTRYGEDLGLGKSGLRRLVEALLDATCVPWIRFLYAYPTTLDDDLLVLMGEQPRFVSYLDIPLQHSHPDMLRAMRRGGRAERYLRLLERARACAGDVFLRTTFIVGFPGERQEHFDHLLAFIEQARFDHLGAFVYSPEDATPSASLPDRVPAGIARRRHQALLAAQEPIARARRQALVGRRLKVLVEGVCSETEHLLEGRHHGMAPGIDGRLLINDGIAPAGSFAEVEITDAFADDLVGRIVGPEGVDGVVPASVA